MTGFLISLAKHTPICWFKVSVFIVHDMLSFQSTSPTDCSQKLHTYKLLLQYPSIAMGLLNLSPHASSAGSSKASPAFDPYLNNVVPVKHK